MRRVKRALHGLFQGAVSKDPLENSGVATDCAACFTARNGGGLAVMMELRQDDQQQFFYDLCLSAHVPEQHILRGIDGFLDFSGIREGLVGGESFSVDGSLIKADANRLNCVAPVDATRAVVVYLDTLDDAAFGDSSKKMPKTLSPVDPAARTTRAHHGKAFFGYITNYLVDLDNGVIVDTEPNTAIRQGEVKAAKRMVTRAQDRFGLYPENLVADSGYGSGEMLNWLINDQGIERHIAVFDKSTRTSSISLDTVIHASFRRSMEQIGLTQKIRRSHGSAYQARDTRIFAAQVDLKPCFTPVASPESNGVAEAFVKTIKCDYVYVSPLPEAKTVLKQIDGWFEDYNDNHPHSALRMRSLREFIWASSQPA